MNRLIILSAIGFANLALAQPVVVSLSGNGNVIAGQDMRAFTVTVAADRDLSSYYELTSAVTSQTNPYPVINARWIKVVEPKNPAFTCFARLSPDTQLVHVTINYPSDFFPYCDLEIFR